MVDTSGVTTNADAEFNLKAGRLNLSSFKALSSNKNEIYLKGWVTTDLLCDLSGEAHLASLAIAGAIRDANGDPQGRLLVPVHLTGNLTSPGIAIASSTIEKMLANTAKAEIKKAATGKLGDELKKRLGGFLKGK